MGYYEIIEIFKNKDYVILLGLAAYFFSKF